MRVFPAFIALLLLCGSTNGQTGKEDKKSAARSALQQAIQNRRYHFLAQHALPNGGRNHILTTPYTLTLRGDTLDSDLPYFGQAYTATIGSSEGGIQFVTTAFTYTVTPAKKDGWEILLELKNQAAASRMYLSISRDGYATLSVQSINRQNISFTGTVGAGKQQ